MLTTTQTTHSPAAPTGMAPSAKGQSLPDEAKFSDLFSSMFMPLSPSIQEGDVQSMALEPVSLTADSALLTNLDAIAESVPDMIQSEPDVELMRFDSSALSVFTQLSALDEVKRGGGSLSASELTRPGQLDSRLNPHAADVVSSMLSSAEMSADTSLNVMSESDTSHLNSLTMLSDDPLESSIGVGSSSDLTLDADMTLLASPLAETNGLQALPDGVDVALVSAVSDTVDTLGDLKPVNASASVVVAGIQSQHAQANEQSSDDMPLAKSMSPGQVLNAPQSNLHSSSVVANGAPANNAMSTAGNPSSAVTQWGTQNETAQNAQSFSQQGQSGQPSSQQGQSSQQQAMLMAQAMQSQKQVGQDQQVALKSVEEALAKSEGRDVLTGSSFVSSERSGFLPTGLQTIPQSMRSPQWGQALGQRVLFMANNSIQQAQITLNPEKLGPVQVKLHMDKDQQLHVTMTAQHGTTRESMENALPRLREMLEQSGINLGSVNVGDQKQFSDHSAEQPPEKNVASGTLTTDEEVMAETQTLRTVSTDNIVDYYA